MGNLGNARIKVNTQVLKQKAEEFTVSLNSLRLECDELDSVFNGTKNYWRGDAADRQRTIYAEYKQELYAILNRLQEHPADLKQMAGIYEGAENSNVQTVLNLPKDVIQ